MPNGKDYILFYLKLLLESVDHEGSLRFSDTIPYNEQMLSVVTNTNIDIVRSAMKLFIELNMMSIYDDQTIYMNEVEKLIGSETKWAEKKRLQRAKEDNVPQLSSKCPTEIELEKELKKDKEIEDIASASDESEAPKRKRFVPPTIDEVKAYCRERQNDVDAERFIDYYTSNGWRVGKNKMMDWEAAVRTWERNTGRTIAVKQNASSDLDDIF
jgi:predicted phage replisome organizer